MGRPSHARPYLILAILLVAGCTAQPQPRAEPSRSASPAPAAAPAATCPPTAEISPGSLGIPERQGVGTGATFWALFFGGDVTAGKEIKVVWRMTGAGDLTIAATNGTGVSVAPVWGPEPHSGSSYLRPGDEWGTGWVFPSAGCWTVRATRATTGTAELVIRVGEKVA